MWTLDKTYLEVRSDICNSYLVAFSSLAIPTLAGSLYRIVDIGWQPVMAVHIFIAATLWFLALYRNRVPYRVRAGVLIFVHFIIGCAGIWTFGLLAASVIWLAAVPILSTVLFGTRSGFITLAGVVLTTGAIGVWTVREQRLPTFDPAAYMTSAPAWGILILSFVIMGGAMAFATGTLNKFFFRALKTSHRDTQALKESEAQHRRLLANIPEVVYSFSDKGGGLYYSPRVMDVLGYSPEHLSKHPLLWHDSIHSDDRPMVDEAIKELHDGKSFDLEYRIQNAYGDWRWLHDRNILIQGDDGETIIDGLATDITERKKDEDEKRVRMAQLSHASRLSLVGELASGMAHEINQPLTAISAYAQTCIRKLDGGEKGTLDRIRADLEKISSQAQRAAEITTWVRGFGKKHPAKRTLHDINAIIHEAMFLSDLERLAPQVQIDYQLSDGLPQLEVDKIQMAQAILNLARNGIEAIEEASGEASGDERHVRKKLTIHTALAPQGRIEISISDNGPGIAPDRQAQIFEPFFTTKESGMGMGLAITKSIIEAQGGTLTLASTPGEGATFTISMPQAK